ncbi:DNA alkylation repair protein [Halocynthiibacter namhaensis]|uniref:DNA alkylation repair protein n=1 Tax=Halocynthiibacter namhaensis TaxID=1290553 RepID=UPI0005798463|nr:DNA alkylation repair protein [Halocynthiibacter namhaensis]
MKTADEALKELIPHIVAGKDAQMQSFHKAERIYLGVPTPAIEAAQKAWRDQMSVEERVELARALWDGDVFEGRIAAAKLLTQARLRPDDVAWELLQSWVTQIDCAAIADQVATAVQKRLTADPSRIEILRTWVEADSLWTKCAALDATLPWAKMNNLKEGDEAIRTEALTWAATYMADTTWATQKAVTTWLTSLAKHDAERVKTFLADHGEALRPSLRKDIEKRIK